MLTVSVASPDDDAALRQLMARGVMPGLASLSLEREPSFFAAADVEGDLHHTIVTRDAAGRITAMASRSRRAAYLSGQRSEVAYLGQFRLAPGRRPGRQLLKAGFDALKKIDALHPARVHFSSVVAENERAHRLLASALPGLPMWAAIDDFATWCLPAASSPRVAGVRRGDEVAAGAVLGCLRRNASRFDLAPAWDTLEGAHLSARDFLVLVDGDEVVGCCAVWDQRAMRQSRVHGYAPWLGALRPLLGPLASLVGVPRLPRVGETLDFAFLSHLYVDGDDADVAARLVRAALAEARRRGLAALLWGAVPSHPLRETVTRRPHLRYDAVLYQVSWEEGPIVAGRPHPEVATL